MYSLFQKNVLYLTDGKCQLHNTSFFIRDKTAAPQQTFNHVPHLIIKHTHLTNIWIKGNDLTTAHFLYKLSQINGFDEAGQIYYKDSLCGVDVG